MFALKRILSKKIYLIQTLKCNIVFMSMYSFARDPQFHSGIALKVKRNSANSTDVLHGFPRYALLIIKGPQPQCISYLLDVGKFPSKILGGRATVLLPVYFHRSLKTIQLQEKIRSLCFLLIDIFSKCSQKDCRYIQASTSGCKRTYSLVCVEWSCSSLTWAAEQRKQVKKDLRSSIENFEVWVREMSIFSSPVFLGKLSKQQHKTELVKYWKIRFLYV